MTTELIELEIEYAAFNALKTVGDARESRFETRRSGGLWVTCDPHRAATYYNRVLGLTKANLADLPGAVGMLRQVECRVDVLSSEVDACEKTLRSLGFRRTGGLLWLSGTPPVADGADAGAGADAAAVRSTPAVLTTNVRRLLSNDSDRARVRELLELEAAVSGDIWEMRKVHQCTDTFRAYGIEENGRLAAMATLYMGHWGAVIGNAFTREECRGRGYQHALLSARLRDAATHPVGAFVDVEAGSTSHRNCLRTGFRPLADVAIYERSARSR